MVRTTGPKKRKSIQQRWDCSEGDGGEAGLFRDQFLHGDDLAKPAQADFSQLSPGFLVAP